MAALSFKESLSTGKTLLGTFLQIPAAECAEIVGYSGFDFGIVDGEHGMLGVDASIQMLRGCDASGLTSIYRVPHLEQQRIGQALDFGASAVMVPNVTTRQEAELAVRAAKYHPNGSRGVCPFTRCGRYNAADEFPDYYSVANESTALVLQIEGIEGIANLEEILDTPNVSAVFIGPFDLSQSMGIPGQVTDARVLNAMKEIVELADSKGIAVGNFAVTPEQAHAYASIGVRFIAYGVDTLVMARIYRDLRRMLLFQEVPS